MSVRRIASLLRLSAATVSMALHDHPRISSATKRRVRAAARRVGYRPNAKVTELMGRIRASAQPTTRACLGVISYYDTERPWEKSEHYARMFAGMVRRADALGYRLEPFWVRAPRLTPRRLRAILDARGIEGLLCFGSPKIDEEFSAELDHYAIVTQGLSIRTPLHRVVNHAYNDTWHALERVHALGYRRPGMVLAQYEEVRGGHANASAYFGWCDNVLGSTAPIPILRMNRVEETPLRDWLRHHRPDVVVIVHAPEVLAEFAQFLRKHELRVPDELGVAAVSQVLRRTAFSGFEENQPLMGEWAVEMLIGRIMNRDIGIPRYPRIEMVEGVWIEGRSLRQVGK